MIYIGTNLDTNSKAISFGAQKLNVGTKRSFQSVARRVHIIRSAAKTSSLSATARTRWTPWPLLLDAFYKVEVIRTDLPDAGWGQDAARNEAFGSLLRICTSRALKTPWLPQPDACCPVALQASQDEMKRIVAQPPATSGHLANGSSWQLCHRLEAVQRTANAAWRCFYSET